MERVVAALSAYITMVVNYVKEVPKVRQLSSLFNQLYNRLKGKLTIVAQVGKDRVKALVDLVADFNLLLLNKVREQSIKVKLLTNLPM